VSEARPGRGRAESALRGHRDLLQWVWNYFTDEGHSGAGPPQETRGGNGRATQPGLRLCGDPVVVSRKPPLYFQHEGHSRTLVGVERRQRHAGQPAEVSLLILDPSQPTAPLVAALRERRQWQARAPPTPRPCGAPGSRSARRLLADLRGGGKLGTQRRVVHAAVPARASLLNAAQQPLPATSHHRAGILL
jgi:hypothetical protein